MTHFDFSDAAAHERLPAVWPALWTLVSVRDLQQAPVGQCKRVYKHADRGSFICEPPPAS